MSGKVKRSRFMAFLNTTPEAQQAAYNLMGDGIKGQTLNYGPQTEENVYIHQDSGETEVVSYKPTMPTPQTATKGDPVFDFVDGLRRKRAVLADAHTDLVLVYAYEEPVGDAYPAEKSDCSIQVDDFGGDGGASLSINYTVNLAGDPVQGMFNPTTKTFTVSASE